MGSASGTSVTVWRVCLVLALAVAHSHASGVGSWDLEWANGFNGVVAPVLRQAHSVSVHNDTVIVFGGYSISNDYLQDCWGLDTASVAWQRYTTIGAPSKRAFHSTAVHKASGTLLVFGGIYRTTHFNDLYALDLTANRWRRLNPTGTLPAARNEQVAVMVGDSMFIYGGTKSSSSHDVTVFGDLWQYRYDINAWRMVAAGSVKPGPRFSHAGALVAAPPFARRLASLRQAQHVMAGDESSQASHTVNVGATLAAGLQPEVRLPQVDDVLEAVESSPSPASSPLASSAPATSSSRRLAHGGSLNTSQVPVFAIFGGQDIQYVRGTPTMVMLKDTWAFYFDNLDMLSKVREWVTGRWVEQRFPGIHFSRIYHSAVGIDGQLVVFGGFSGLRQEAGRTLGYIYNDVLAAQISSSPSQSWRVADVSGMLPSARYGHHAGAVGGHMHVFGGRDSQFQSGVWEFSSPPASSDLWRPVNADDFEAGTEVSAFLSSPTFMIAILACMVLCFCVFIFSLRRSSHRHGRNFDHNFGGGVGVEMGNTRRAHEAAMQTGVPPYILDTLPEVVYHAPDAGSGSGAGQGSGDGADGGDVEVDNFGQVSCPICLCDYEEGEALTQLRCKHRYHPQCVRQWLKQNKHCPMCKANVMSS